MNFKINTKLIILISSIISILLVSFIALNANRYIMRMSENNSEIYSAYRISELMKSFKNNIGILESKQRGYIVTGNAKFLEEYRLCESETKTYLKSMEKYFSGKPEEEAFYKLKELTYKKLTEGKNLNTGSSLFSTENASAGSGLNIMTEIFETVDEINLSLSKTTKVLLDNSIGYVSITRYWSFLAVAFGILVVLTALIVLLRDLRIRNKLADELHLAKLHAEDNAMMKEQFMANMSHEIRTPMNAILGFSNLLQKTSLNPAQSEYLTAIKTSGFNLLNIINDILDFSKIEAGKLNIEKISFNILSLLDSLKFMFLERAGEKQIAFEIVVDKNMPPFIFGDPTRLTQILVNLISNAIKFTNKGSVKVCCEVKNIEHETVQLVFRVKDTGIGISSDKLGLVFERFNQGNAETTRLFGGTGLGLSIVKSLVEILNGDIVVHSKKDIGSEFIVTLSFPISYDDKYGVVSPSETQLVPFTHKSFRVLIAEDNTLNQKLTGNYCKAFGLEPDIAENGEIALEMLRNTHYDLVLMDIQMPVIDGYTASKKIREELGLGIPVIAMTAHTMKEEREKCLSHGMNDYISKPFKEAELYKIIYKYLGEQEVPNQKNKSTKIVEPETSEKIILTKNKTGVVDLNELYSMARGRNIFIKEIIDIFLTQTPKDLFEMENAMLTGDYKTIQILAHRMRTSLGFIGMKQLLPALGKIEELAAEHVNMENITQLFYPVKIDCLLAIIELKELASKIEIEK